MDFHKTIRSQITRAAAMAMNLDAMAQKDQYVNSDTSNGRSKELVNDPLQPMHHTNLATAKFQGFPLEIHNESSDDDDDDFESDPIMNMISKQKTSLHKSVPSESLGQSSPAHHNKDPNRFLKAMEARASKQTDATVSSSTTQSKDTSAEPQVSAVPSLGITDKMEWMKSSFFNPSQFKTQLLSRIPFHPLMKYDEEEAVPQDSMRNGDEARRDGHNSSQPVVLSTSILRPEETMELIRLQAATRSSSTHSNLLLFFYFLQDKLVQHRCMAVIGLLVIFVYVIKGMFLNRVYS